MIAMSRQQLVGPCSGHMAQRIAQVIFVGLATMILVVSSSTATATPQGSFTAELLHREHLLSPLRSPDDMDQVEKFRNQVQRSAARSRILSQRSLANASTFETTVDWDPDAGEYFMRISLGTPPQSFVAIADTGSDLTWVQCAPCTDCYNQTDPVYIPSLSSTYSQLSCSSSACQKFASQNDLDNVTTCNSSTSCPFFYSYGDGSFTVGNLSSESITLTSTSGGNVTGGNVTVPDFWFGCSHNSTDETAAIDGLVGLGQGLVSFPSQLGHDFQDKFSYCLVNSSLSPVRSSLLVFGLHAVSASISAALQYTPILRNPVLPYYYYVGLEGISVNKVALKFSAKDVAIARDGSGGTIFDSGTTVTQLTPLVFDLLLVAIVTAVPQDYQIVPANVSAEIGSDLCYDITGKQDYESVFPSISFKFGNASAWDLRFENSWFTEMLDAEEEIACLAFARGDSAAGGNIFGNTQQQDFYLVYDRVTQRIGYAATDCSSLLS